MSNKAHPEYADPIFTMLELHACVSMCSAATRDHEKTYQQVGRECWLCVRGNVMLRRHASKKCCSLCWLLPHTSTHQPEDF